MRPGRSACAMLLAALQLVPATIAAQASSQEHRRLYLMAADSQYLYWSVDPDDPELDVTTVARTCGTGQVWGTPDAEPCLSGPDLENNGLRYSIFFFPATLLDSPIAWSGQEPLRYRLGLQVSSALPYTVHFLIQKTGPQIESQPATQTASGVWEGSISTGSPVEPAAVNILGIRIKTRATRVTMELETGGASYVELPDPVSARSVPALLAASTYAPSPSRYSTPTRSFAFNDDAWTVDSFTGNLSQEKTVGLTLHRNAASLIAWIEMFDTPFVHDVIRGRPPEPRKLTDWFEMELSQNGEVVTHTFGLRGRGTDALAALDLPAGDISVTVRPLDGSEASTYTVYVLAIHGPRTLASMRWRYTHPSDLLPLPDHRSPVSASCPASAEPIPVTDEATTFLVDLDWDTVGPLFPKWTLRFSLPNVGYFPCGEVGTGDRVRFTIRPAKDVWYVGATPAQDGLFASWEDTVFEMETRFAYTPSAV